MLEKITHIEGLEAAYDDVEVFDDTPPGATQVTFEVRSEEMPYKSAVEGRLVKENFVWIKKVMDLGRSVLERRIYDTVEFDSINEKWVIKKLAVQSDIKRYPESWNAFARNAKQEDIGTPLSLLFKNDPSRVDMYKGRGIRTVEQLMSLTDAHVQDLGMGVSDDRRKALSYMKRIEAQAPKLALDTLLEEKEASINALRDKVVDLEKLIKAMQEAEMHKSTPEKRKLGRPRKITQEEVKDIESIEGTEDLVKNLQG